jgi:glycerol transport system ATP-binding protein
MARIEFVDLAHSYSHARESAPLASTYSLEPTALALRPMNITWNDGGAYALLGPSGCGKTTLLNIISGLVTPTRGKVLFDGRDVTALPPQQRNIAQVFQFPVIYDTMTVFDNLAFPLRNRGWKEGDTRKRVQEVAELLELASDLKHRASGLTADAKQKISLGRGLVRPDVAAVLFDEPLTVIDPHLKWLLRRKLKQIHQQLKLSLIYVTHDQIEALTFADTVVVMTQGEVVQSGTAQALFETPEHTFVGHFIGNPGMNFLPCELKDDTAIIDGHTFAIQPPLASRVRSVGGPFKLGIRPEFIECVADEQPGARRIQINSVQPMGTHTMIAAQLGKHPLWIKARHDVRLASNTAWMRVRPEHVLVYANERRIA